MHINHWLGIVFAAAPIIILLVAEKRKYTAEKAHSRLPFSESLLRPPGEHLRLEIGALEDQMRDRSLVLIVLVVLPVFIVLSAPLHGISTQLVGWLSIPCLCYAGAILQWRKLCGQRESLRNHRLGFDGERYVGAELGALASRGYQIFHDCAFQVRREEKNATFNIDHIAIGPAGVFAIETKTRRKPNQPQDARHRTYEVVYNGKSLKFPSGHEDTKSIKQALGNAAHLSKWLSELSDDFTWVDPVIVIPGWFVKHQDSETSVSVLSGKQLRTWEPHGSRGGLTDKQIRQIADKVERHCRDIAKA